jgi:gluconolactonase
MKPHAQPLVSIESFSLFADGLDHPEGLAFDRAGDLWAGGERGQIYRISPEGHVATVAELGGFNLGITVSLKGTLFACNFKLGALLEVDSSGRLLRTVDHVGAYALRNPNFSVADHEGNLYFSDSGEFQRNEGFVFCLRPNGSVETLLSGLGFPNGLALSADERTLFVVLSNSDSVLAVPLPVPARAGQPRIFAEGLGRVPDGAALDTAGHLYVTCYATHCVYRISPVGEVTLFAFDPTGTMLASPTNAAFGGANRDILYFANLSRWHICSVRVATPGQLLAHQLQELETA